MYMCGDAIVHNNNIWAPSWNCKFRMREAITTRSVVTNILLDVFFFFIYIFRYHCYIMHPVVDTTILRLNYQEFCVQATSSSYEFTLVFVFNSDRLDHVT